MITRNIKLQRNSKCTITASSFFQIIGICIILTALIYMLVNLHKADSIIAIWIPFMVAGVWLTFTVTFIKLLGYENVNKMNIRK